MTLAPVLLGALLVTATCGEEVGTSHSRSKKATVPSSHVREVQEALQQSGYNPGPIDGIMGPRTKAALRRYIAVPPPKVPSPADEVIARFRSERREAP
jgi:peptidoglycan hydrolase-like protein with peptidoglycan-binding domain